MITAQQALDRLQEGNAYYTNNQLATIEIGEQERRELVKEQKPFAIILGCSDSRVPAELVFNQGVGDLFVIRVAGNIVAPSQIGSIEFAAATFGTQLVVVMGHSHCGAVSATLSELRQPSEQRSPNLHSIVSRISPAVAGLLEAGAIASEEDLLSQAVKANIRASVDNLLHGSEILENLVSEKKLHIVGAEYCLETGVVTFFKGLEKGSE